MLERRDECGPGAEGHPIDQKERGCGEACRASGMSFSGKTSFASHQAGLRGDVLVHESRSGDAVHSSNGSFS
jgi:hypothetical protein